MAKQARGVEIASGAGSTVAARAGMEVDVLADANSVLESCRRSGISIQEAVIRDALGKRGHVVEVDNEDASINVRFDVSVAGVHSIWFPAQALRLAGACQSQHVEPASSSSGAPVDSLSPEQVEEIRNIFKLFDKDGSGDICIDELRGVMQALGMQPTNFELQNMIREVDFDGNGEISFDEFLALIVGKMGRDDSTMTYLMDAFKIFDRDGNGFISVAELRHVVTNLEDPPSDEKLDEMIRQVDANRDGSLSYAEFLTLMAMRTSAVARTFSPTSGR